MRHFPRLSATDLPKEKKVDVAIDVSAKKIENFPLVWGRGNREMGSFLVRGFWAKAP